MAVRHFAFGKVGGAAELWYSNLSGQNILKSRGSVELWSDLYKPEHVNEVAIHHDKLREVTEACMRLKSRSGYVVLLTGPPGSSKSSCLLTVSRGLDFLPPLIWDENDSEDGDTTSSEMQRFEEFLLKSTRYSFLGVTSSLPLEDHTDKSVTSRQLILIENMPSGFIDNPKRFHDCLILVLSNIVVPTLLAFVLTKCSSSNNIGNPITYSFDTATVNRLFPSCLKEELGIRHIEFNPVAPSIMKKALSRIVTLVSSEVGSCAPPKSFLQQLVDCSCGDIRLAINNLQFILMSGTRSKGDLHFDDDPFRRGAGIALFHALGKILHAKRLGDATPSSETLIPPHLQIWQRPPLSFNPESVLDQSGLSGDDVVAWLHENYLAFHDSPETSFEALKWVSSQIGWADAYLSGGMNWRLGLTPAADRNSSSLTACTAGNHYVAMAVARAIAIQLPSRDCGTRVSRFRPLKAPQSKLVETRRRDLLNTLRSYCESSVEKKGAKDILIGGFEWILLDRLPIELAILGPKMHDEVKLVSSMCYFQNLNETLGSGIRSSDRIAGQIKRKSMGRVFVTERSSHCGGDDNLPPEVCIEETFSDE